MLMDPLICKKRDQECSTMKSAFRNEDCSGSLTPSLQATKKVHVDETAKPLAFTFVPIVRRLPVHIQVIDTTRSSPQPGKQQMPKANSSIMNEPLHITEEMPSEDVTITDSVGGGTPQQQEEISQGWLNNKRGDVSAEETVPLQGIFKAELVFLADSYETNNDCLSREDEAAANLSAKTSPSLSLSPNPFGDDKRSFIQTRVVVDESKTPLLQDAEQKVDGALEEPFFQYKIKSTYKAFAAIPTNTLLLEQKAIDEAISDSEESAAVNVSDKTHSQFLIESESLRQQSEELYATIEQLLEDPLPMRSSSSTPKSLPKPQDSKAYKRISPTPKSAGRETKYANLHLSTSESVDDRPTRPGVIRPVTMVQKTATTSKVDDSCHNPFRQCTEATSDTETKEPRHSITTIHENEALGIDELTDITRKLNRDQHQCQKNPRGSPLSITDSNQEALVILEEELEQGVETS